MHYLNTQLLKIIMPANSQHKTKSWFYVFLQNFLLPYYTNLDKTEICKKCTHIEVFPSNIQTKTPQKYEDL